MLEDNLSALPLSYISGKWHSSRTLKRETAVKCVGQLEATIKQILLDE